MLEVEDYAAIRHAYYVEHKSVRAIARALHCAPKTIQKALDSATPPTYTRTVPRTALQLGPYKEQMTKLLVENTTLPRKQRYTGHKIFLAVQAAGYTGSESGVRNYLWRFRKTTHRPEIFLPLEFDPGQDAQADWGEAEVLLAGVQTTVQLFVMRLNYSRQLFVRAYPTQEQESFFDGHVHAFEFFGGVPHRISYDNLRTAVRRVLLGRKREEQRSFITFRSHYLYAARFCTPAEGHEKGGVESGVGYARRNFCVPLPVVADFAELNALLQQACTQDAQRTVARQPRSIQTMWEEERPHLRPVPTYAYECCVTTTLPLNPYGQLTYATNRYSVPADRARATLVLKAYPFQIKISDGTEVIACHSRCYGREQDILDLAHYLPRLAQRPGAVEHAKPLRQARAHWPPVYEQLFQTLQAQSPPETAFFPEFAGILKLRTDHPLALVEQAIAQALAHGCPHLAGVRLCLHQLEHPEVTVAPLDLTARPHLATIGQQPVNLQQYEQLLGGD